MVIRVNSSNIQIGNFSLEENSNGLFFNGIINSSNSFTTDTPYQGTVAGYTSGGNPGTPSTTNVIDKFPFASGGNATDAGDLFQARATAGGNSSELCGYTSGGISTITVPYVFSDTVDRFPFSSFTTATDVGNLVQATGFIRSGTHSSITHGYTTGGSVPPTPSDAITNQIQKFPFQAVFATASDMGDLIATKTESYGSSSSEHGYTTGGQPYGGSVNLRIERFPFSYDSSSVDVGDITEYMQEGGSGSSKTHGYVVGSYGAPAVVNKSDILKFGFASQSNTNNIGDLISAIYRNAGQSSTTHGYSSGGFNQNPGGPPAPVSVNVIEKYSFITDGNGVDSGDLTVSRRSASGQQD
jgi:hypothetical protein